MKPAFKESDLSDADREYLATLRERMEERRGADGNAEVNFRANRRITVIDHLVSEGRFDILDKGLADEDRAAIANMSQEQFTEYLGELRDHLDVDTLINDCGPSGAIAHDPAEKAVRFIGEVVGAWMDKQVESEMSSLADTLSAWDSDRGTMRQVQAEMAYRLRFQECAQNIGTARAGVLMSALDAAVGAREDVSADISSQKKLIGGHLRDVSKFYPDSWKQSVDKSCNPLRVYPSASRAHYCGSKPRSKKGWIPANVPWVLFRTTEVPSAVSLSPYFESGVNRDETEVVIGGDPSNPDHVALNEEAAAALNAALDRMRLWVGGRTGSIKASSQVRFVVDTTAEGNLTLRKERYDNLPGREAVIRVSQDSPGTLAHELAHRMEDGNAHVRELEARFLSRRAEGEEPVGYHGDKQEFYPDNFTHTYVGKVYNDGYREVLSTGMEMLLYGRAGAGVGSEISLDRHTKKGEDRRTVSDRDHLNFVLGMLFSARKSR